MDINIVKEHLERHLPTKKAVEEAASVLNVSVATMYRYKANPDTIGLGKLGKLAQYLGMPLENGAAWSKSDVLGSERRRLELEQGIAFNGGQRFTTVPAYTVNSELPEITRLLLKTDYGIKANLLDKEVMKLRNERIKLYDEEKYESWEIWDAYGYIDFYYARGRYKDIPERLRKAQIEKLIESSNTSSRHRYAYLRNSPDLPMFGCYSTGVALVRIDDIHIEFHAHELIESFKETFNHYIDLSATKTNEQFIEFLSDPKSFKNMKS